MLIQWSYSSSWPTASFDWAPRLEELLTKDRGAPLLCLLLVHLKCVSMNTKALLRTHQVNSLQLILDGCFALRAGGASPRACVCACAMALLCYRYNRELCSQNVPHLTTFKPFLHSDCAILPQQMN